MDLGRFDLKAELELLEQTQDVLRSGEGQPSEAPNTWHLKQKYGVKTEIIFVIAGRERTHSETDTQVKAYTGEGTLGKPYVMKTYDLENEDDIIELHELRETCEDRRVCYLREKRLSAAGFVKIEQCSNLPAMKHILYDELDEHLSEEFNIRELSEDSPCNLGIQLSRVKGHLFDLVIAVRKICKIFRC